MFSPFEKLLILRYLWPGAGGRVVLLVAGIGCAGVAMGVASLILVVSFMNGAQARLASQISSVDGHLSVTRARHELADWRTIRRLAERTPGVSRAVPSLATSGMVSLDGRTFAADVQGLENADLSGQPPVGSGTRVTGALPTGTDEVAVGSGLARRLGAIPGDRIAISLMTNDRDMGLAMRTIGFRLSGIVETGSAAYDEKRAVVVRGALRSLLGSGDIASRIDVTLTDERRIETVRTGLRRRLGKSAIIRSWREMNATLFKALAAEKVGMATIMSLVTIVALFNIMSSLVMLIRFKTREIAILRTMGATRRTIARIFVAVASSIGTAGIGAGLMLGLGLVAAKNPLTHAARATVGRSSIEFDVLLSLPLTISMSEVAWIAGTVMIGLVASTLYPAMKAASTDPASVLRYT